MMGDRLRGQLEARGWAVTSATTTKNLVAIASRLGTPIETRRGAGVVDVLRARVESDAPKRSLSGKHGLGRFPFHTDFAHYRNPPRWVLLRASESSGCATVVADTRRLELSPTERSAVAGALWIVDPGRRHFLASALSRDGLTVRYDAACMHTAHARWAPMTALFTDAIALLPSEQIVWSPMRVLILDNARIVHGREPVPGSKHRQLQRVVVEERTS